MPGASATAKSQLRFRMGNAASSASLMLLLTCVDEVSISGACDVTVTVSSRVPSTSVMSSVAVVPISRTTARRSYFLNPAISDVIWYGPGTMPVTK